MQTLENLKITKNKQPYSPI